MHVPIGEYGDSQDRRDKGYVFSSWMDTILHHSQQRFVYMQLTKERLLFLLRLKEGDEVLFIESDEAETVVVELKDVLNNRIWFSNKKSVRCNDGCYSYEDVVGSRKYRRIEPILEKNKFTPNYCEITK